MNSQLTKEQLDLFEILKLLEETFNGKDTKKIDEAKNKLQQNSKIKSMLFLYYFRHYL